MVWSLDVDVADFVLVGVAVRAGSSFDSGFHDFPAELNHIFDVFNFLLRGN